DTRRTGCADASSRGGGDFRRREVFAGAFLRFAFVAGLFLAGGARLLATGPPPERILAFAPAAARLGRASPHIRRFRLGPRPLLELQRKERRCQPRPELPVSPSCRPERAAAPHSLETSMKYLPLGRSG